MSNEENVWSLDMGKLLNVSNGNKQTVIRFESGSITLNSDSFNVDKENIQIPSTIKNSQSIDLMSSKNSSKFIFPAGKGRKNCEWS